MAVAVIWRLVTEFILLYILFADQEGWWYFLQLHGAFDEVQ